GRQLPAVADRARLVAAQRRGARLAHRVSGELGPRLAKRGAGSTNARGPAELLRGTWAFQLRHLTGRRRWWGRRNVSGGLTWCHRRSRPNDESVPILDPPLDVGGALNGSLRSSSVLVAR